MFFLFCNLFLQKNLTETKFQRIIKINKNQLRGELTMTIKDKAGINAYLQSLVDEDLTPCISIAAAYKGEVVYEGCAARKDDPLYNGYNPSIHHNIGSVTKIITGALFAKVLETGKVTVHHNVKRFLPEYPYDDNTILQLLCHSTGYASFLRDLPRPSIGVTTDEYVDMICKNNSV